MNLIINCVILRNCCCFTLHYIIPFLAFNLVDFIRFTEQEQWQCKIDKCILILFYIVSFLYEFVNFSCNTSCYHCCSGCNGWNNLASNHFSFLLVTFWDFVISCSKICSSMNKVYVEVCIIILFKISRMEFSVFDLNKLWI